jgi:hypothetical protein
MEVGDDHQMLVRPNQRASRVEQQAFSRKM